MFSYPKWSNVDDIKCHQLKFGSTAINLWKTAHVGTLQHRKLYSASNAVFHRVIAVEPNLSLNTKLSFSQRPPATAFLLLCLDLDSITLVHELDLKILKMLYLRTKIWSMSRLSKVRALQTDRQTQRQREREMQLNALPCHIREWQQRTWKHRCSNCSRIVHDHWIEPF